MKKLIYILSLILLPFCNYAQDSTQTTPLTIEEYMEHGISNPADYWYKFEYESDVL